MSRLLAAQLVDRGSDVFCTIQVAQNLGGKGMLNILMLDIAKDTFDNRLSVSLA